MRPSADADLLLAQYHYNVLVQIVRELELVQGPSSLPITIKCNASWLMIMTTRLLLLLTHIKYIVGSVSAAWYTMLEVES